MASWPLEIDFGCRHHGSVWQIHAVGGDSLSITEEKNDLKQNEIESDKRTKEMFQIYEIQKNVHAYAKNISPVNS